MAAQTNTNYKEIAATAIFIQEQEKEKLGKELHDNINQLLAAGKLYLSLASSEEDMRLPMIHQTISIMDTAIKELNALSRMLMKPHFKEDSLNELLSSLVEGLQHKVPASVSYTFSNLHEKSLSEGKKNLIYRAVQEQLDNIAKYAKAENITVSITEQKGHIHLSIKDDGIGFDATNNLKGTGLKDIQNRLKLEHGTMQIITAPGTGCEIQIILPV